MQKIDIAELRRLLADGEAAPIRWAQNAAAVWNALPALLDELEAARLEIRRQASVISELRAEEALAALPSRSLAAHDAALLREVANLIRQTTPEPVDGVPESFGAHQGRMYAIEQIESKADRIEKESPHA